MSVSVPVVAIDGPSGVGKGTLCRLLAAALDWHVLDSGSLYRLTALAVLNHGVDFEDEPRIARLAAGLDVQFEGTADTARVLLEGVEVTDAIRSEECGNAASRVAVITSVRQALLQRQRDFRQPPGLIADGRDMGTVVFPDAQVKIFLVASAEERANRRYKQLMEKGMGASLPALTREIAERDERDARRTISPLRPAQDAITLDTTGLGIDAVRRRALTLVREKL